MTSVTDDLRLAADFAPATYDDWRKLVDGVLKGAPFEKLVGKTYDGLKIDPIYQRARRVAPIAGRAAGVPWQIMQRIDHPDAAHANAQALHDLENGATGLTLVFAGANGAYGFGLEPTAEAIDRVLDGVFIDAGISIELQVGPQSRMAAIHLAEYVKRKGLAPAACDIRFGLDPIGACAVWGSSPYAWAEIVPAVTGAIKGLAAMGFKGPFAVADGRVIHDAGGSEVQELAFVLAAGVAYLRALEGAGVALEDARSMVYARLSADADQFLTMAKFRALRLLWARIEQSCGLAPKPLFIAADTAWRMLTQRDPYVNMLRATMATFSAGLGGADTINVLPHTLALGLPDPFARRVARNTQLVLLEESNLAKVSDPAAGSGGIETLTQQLCEAAWSLFQEIEEAGGVFAALEQSLIQRKVAATRSAREANIATAQGSADRRQRISKPARGSRRGAGGEAGCARALWRGQIQIRRAAADAAGGAVRTPARPFGSDPERQGRAAKGLSRQSRHACRLHRARNLCQELFRDRRDRGGRYRRIYRTGCAGRRVQGLRRGAGLSVLIRQDLCRAGERRRKGPSSRRREAYLSGRAARRTGSRAARRGR